MVAGLPIEYYIREIYEYEANCIYRKTLVLIFNTKIFYSKTILVILSTFSVYINPLHRTFIALLSSTQIILRKNVHVYSLH